MFLNVAGGQRYEEDLAQPIVVNTASAEGDGNSNMTDHILKKASA